VICNVAPDQLYGRLVPDGSVPRDQAEAGRRYRFGRAGMQLHYALSELPGWEGDERLLRTPIVHLTPGLDGVSRAVNEADCGLLPAEATIACGQPLAVDPSRAPDGSWILWVQLQELPSRPTGDAAGELDVGDGTWTEALREAYADRIEARLARHIPNLERATLARRVYSPADLEAANPNFVGGDIYCGALSLDQNLVWRPRPQLPGHRTAVPRLWHIGASTHPGPGLGAGSGTIVAHELLREPLPRRLASRLPFVGGGR
jgi:phytoene dehydrogenase-like protein